MLPTFTALFDGHRWYCQQRGFRYTQRDLAHLRPMFDEVCALVTARLRPLP